MKREFIVERNGRAFVMYAGLLNLAHESGLSSIRTELVQAPTDENRNVAICTATVVLERDGKEQVYTGIGDAAENNVSAAMRSSLIRMAETRAKARALRDAVNVGVSAFEELSEADGPDSAGRNLRPRVRQERGGAVPGEGSGRSHMRPSGSPEMGSTDDHIPVSGGSAPITVAQANAITSLCLKQLMDANALARDRFEAEELSQLTAVQAGELIRSLTASGRTRPAVAAA